MRLLLFIGMIGLCAAPACAQEPPTVRLELADHSKVEGVWESESIQFKSEYGDWRIEPRKVKALELSETGDVIVFDGLDHRFHGNALIEKLRVNGQDYDRGRLRSLKQIHGGPTNWLHGIIIPL